MDHSVISHTAHSSLSSQVMDGHNGQKPWMEEVMYRVDQKIEFYWHLGMAWKFHLKAVCVYGNQTFTIERDDRQWKKDLEECEKFLIENAC